MSLIKKEQWEQLNIELQRVLKRAITLRQEILSNLSQQEYLLLIGDIGLKEQLYQDCKYLSKQLRSSAREQNIIVGQLIALSLEESPDHSLTTLLNPINDLEAETLILYQTLQALVEKIHGQQIRNKTLFALVQKQLPKNINHPSIHTKTVYSETKPLLITINYPKEKH